MEEADDGEMREEYDFAHGEVGRYADRFKEGTNLVLIDPSVMDVFPDARSVNEALRALAPIVRSRRAASQ